LCEASWTAGCVATSRFVKFIGIGDDVPESTPNVSYPLFSSSSDEEIYLEVNRGMKSQLSNFKSDSGSATAEYAIATMAAVGFAGLLVVIMRSDEVKALLYDLVMKALTVATP
jgi:hypothetical protein